MTMPGGGRSLADVFVQLHVDGSRVPRDVRDATEKPIGDAGEKAGSNFGKRMTAAIGAAVAAGAVFMGAKLVQGLKASVQSASDLNETLQKTETVFGKGADAVTKWSETMATKFGQSQKAALDAASTFAIYGKQANLTEKDLFKFSTGLSHLASDMASFSNTSVEEAIQSIGAAMRGENDPIEKYGVLLNEARLQAIALEKGIIKGTTSRAKIQAANVAVTETQRKWNAAVKEHGAKSLEARKAQAAFGLAQERLKKATEGTVQPLTAQQRVLAVQAALFDQLGKKGSNTIGDFERNMQSLSNQQRIAQANTENLRAEIGAAFLPVVTKLYTIFNTKVIPALQAVWREHGPALTRWASGAADRLGEMAEGIDDIDFAAFGAVIQDKVIPALKDLKEGGGSGLGDTLKVTGVVFKYLADNADLLGKALPYLIAGFITYKTVMAASNAVAVLSPAITLANMFANRRLAAANLELAASITAQTAATRTSTVTKVAETAATNAGNASRLRAVAAYIAQVPAMVAARAATIAGTIAQWAHNAAWLAFPGTWIIAAIILVVGAIVLLWKKNEGFRNLVMTVWAAIKKAIGAVKDWFVGTLWPSLKKAFDQLMAVSKAWWNIASSVWKGVWTAISTYYGFMWNKVFVPLKNFILHTLPDAFKKGIDTIKGWWAKLQEYAAKPVRFVIETVINRGLIGTFNKVSGFFGGPKVPEVKLPGGMGDGHGQPGTGDGPGKKGTGDGLGDIISFFKGPASWIKKRVDIGGIASKFGKNPLTDTLSGVGKKLLGSLIDKAKSLMEVSGGGGTVGEGGLRSGIRGVMAGLRSTFGNVGIISGLRPGATTLTGNRSYHASGRAVDLRAYLPWAQYLNAVYGRQLRELITPWQHLNILNGRPHTYTGAVWNQHNFAGGNAHIHAAMDDGGRRFLMPGLNVIPNGTGAKEPIYGPAEIGDVVDRLEKILAALEALGPAIGRELTGATAASLTLARARGTGGR